MSTERIKGRLNFICDACGEAFEDKDGCDFATVWSALRSDGWTSRKYGKDWHHRCPDCEWN